MTDQALNRWIVEKVFKECWHEEIEDGSILRCAKCKQAWATHDGKRRYNKKEVREIIRPNLCTPDGSALLKAKAIELGEWKRFECWHWNQCAISNSYNGSEKFVDLYAHDTLIEILTTPRLFAEAFRAYWEQRGK